MLVHTVNNYPGSLLRGLALSVLLPLQVGLPLLQSANFLYRNGYVRLNEDPPKRASVYRCANCQYVSLQGKSDSVADFEMKRLSWIIRLTQCNYKDLCKRVGGSEEKKEVQ